MSSPTMANEIIKTTDTESVALLEQAESVIREGLQTFFEVGNALADIRDQKRYRLRGYATFEAYCTDEWQFTDRRARQLISAAEVMQHIKETGTTVPVSPASEAQVRPLTQASPEERPAIWQAATEKAADEGKPVAARHVEAAVSEAKASRNIPPPPVSIPVTTAPPPPAVPVVVLTWSGEIRRAYYNFKDFQGNEQTCVIEVEQRANELGTFQDISIDGRKFSTVQNGIPAAQKKVAAHLASDTRGGKP